MKKWLVLILVLILIPSFAFADMEFSRDEYGNFCSLYTSEYDCSYNVTPETLPYTFGYNDKQITILESAFYQAKIGYGYYPFFHFRLDVSQLTEDEIYWFREDDISALCFCLPDLETKDYTYFSVLLNLLWTDSKMIDIVFYDDDVSRYPFDGYSVFCSLETEHPKGLVIPFNSENVTINSIDISLNKTDVSPMDIHEMNSMTFVKVQENLFKKGIELK